METFIGIDPGGKNAFGWCVMEADSASRVYDIVGTGTCSEVSDVISAIKRVCTTQPIAAGIDAPLYWSRIGERLSDRKIRTAVNKAGSHSSTVGHVNSLRGACLVQGVLAAVALVEIWPQIAITESHPKALLAVWPDAKSFVQRFDFNNDHERDAALGAYAAFAFNSKWDGWINLAELEENKFVPSGGRIVYWFPRL